ncbi:MAG: diguanylate cyclase [Proteobacteria bacterium]|nr:diguanylate cyclase [Pseudomonadota bacterium]
MITNNKFHQVNQLLRFTPGKSYASTLIFWMVVGNLPLLLVIFFLYQALAPTFQRAPSASLALAASLIWLIASYFIIARLLSPVKHMASLLQNQDEPINAIPASQYTIKHDAGIMLNNLQSLISREQLLRNWLNEMTPEEHLTGFYSHDWTEARLEEDLTRAHRQKEKLSVLLLEVSNHDDIKDHAGLTTANYCLLSLAQLAKSATRKGDWLSRWQSNQILLVLWNDQDQATKICKRIFDTFKTVKFVNDANQPLTVIPKVVLVNYNGTDSTKVVLAKLQHCLTQHQKKEQAIIHCSDDVLLSVHDDE